MKSIKAFKDLGVEFVAGDKIINVQGTSITLLDSLLDCDESIHGLDIYTEWMPLEFAYRPMPIPDMVASYVPLQISDSGDKTLWRPDIEAINKMISDKDKISKFLTPNDALRSIVGEGNFHIFTDVENDTTQFIVEKTYENDALLIAEHFNKINDTRSLSVITVDDPSEPNLGVTLTVYDSPSLENVLDAVVPEVSEILKQVKEIEPHVIGDILPKEGEWWVCECKNIHGKVEGYSYEATLFFNGSNWCFDNEANKPVPFDAVPIARLYTQKELHEITTQYQNDCAIAKQQCREHEETINKLTDGFHLISEACKSRGLGDRPYADIIKLLSDAEDKLTNLENKPKEVVSLQIDGLPPLDSVVYLSPSREAGNGKPGFTAVNPGRKVKIYAHFTNDQDRKLAAYTSVEGNKPMIGGVAAALAFETEEQKQEREIDSIFEDVLSSAQGMDKEIARRIAAGLHSKDYYKGEK